MNKLALGRVEVIEPLAAAEVAEMTTVLGAYMLLIALLDLACVVGPTGEAIEEVIVYAWGLLVTVVKLYVAVEYWEDDQLSQVLALSVCAVAEEDDEEDLEEEEVLLELEEDEEEVVAEQESPFWTENWVEYWNSPVPSTMISMPYPLAVF